MKITFEVQTFGDAEAARQMLDKVWPKSAPIGNVEMTVAKQVEASAPQPQPDQAPQSDTAPHIAAPTKTVDDVLAAFQDYVKRGQGRTALTAKGIMTEFGLASLKAANPEQCVQLCERFAA